MDAINALVALAEKLSQGGVVLMLVAFILVLMYTVSVLFKEYKSSNTQLLTAFIANTEAIEANTMAAREATKQSEANKNSIEALSKALLEVRRR